MKSILIVDDDPSVLDFVSMKLVGKYLPVTTHKPREVLAMIRENRPDLVLCDLDMPAIGGAELAASIRKEFPGLPVMFISGLVTPAEAKAGAIKGERVISKLANVAELLDAVEAVIGH